ncbi:RDD family protein [compost metagenome]
MTHAGFWKRFLAYILDFLVLCFFTIIVSFFVQIIHAILGGGTSSSVQYTESDVSMFSTIVSMLSGFFLLSVSIGFITRSWNRQSCRVRLVKGHLAL